MTFLKRKLAQICLVGPRSKCLLRPRSFLLKPLFSSCKPTVNSVKLKLLKIQVTLRRDAKRTGLAVFQKHPSGLGHEGRASPRATASRDACSFFAQILDVFCLDHFER